MLVQKNRKSYWRKYLPKLQKSSVRMVKKQCIVNYVKSGGTYSAWHALKSYQFMETKDCIGFVISGDHKIGKILRFW